MKMKKICIIMSLAILLISCSEENKTVQREKNAIIKKDMLDVSENIKLDACIKRCQWTTDKKGCIDICNINEARMLKDEKICEKVESKEELRSSCYIDIAKLKKDEKICKNIWSEDDFLAVCIWELARIKQNASICDILLDETKRQLCKGLSQ